MCTVEMCSVVMSCVVCRVEWSRVELCSYEMSCVVCIYELCSV